MVQEKYENFEGHLLEVCQEWIRALLCSAYDAFQHYFTDGMIAKMSAYKAKLDR
jgi:hypothetical protein